ncbi:MAG: hypothetical protein P1V21_12455 [Rhizobiaceae bacterium]|nr:hypothetical protein [Rhizobiaceae bacterium]
MFALGILFLSTAHSRDKISETSDNSRLISNEILVFYANETPLGSETTQNYQKLFGAIRESKLPGSETIIAALRSDAVRFPVLVKQQSEIIARASKRYGFDAVIFTNSLANRKKFRLVKGDGIDLEVTAFQGLRPNPSEVLKNSPLARLDYFKAAIDIVTGLSEAENKAIILITSSHGDERIAIMPRIVVDLSRVDHKEYVQALQHSSVSTDGPIPWILSRGISKKQMWDTISEIKRETQFSLVFQEACKSGLLSFDEYLSLPKNIEKFAHFGGRNIALDEIDYSKILSNISTEINLSQHLIMKLSDQGAKISKNKDLFINMVFFYIKKYTYMVFFLPLFFWVMYYSYRSLKARRNKL